MIEVCTVTLFVVVFFYFVFYFYYYYLFWCTLVVAFIHRDMNTVFVIWYSNVLLIPSNVFLVNSGWQFLITYLSDVTLVDSF